MNDVKNNLIVVDFEATCTQEYDPEFRDRQEIIEFGICVVDANHLEIINKQSIIVRPVFNPKLTSFCTELTGITQNQVDCGVSFDTALAWFKATLEEFKVHTFCCWGDFDWKLLAKNCLLHKQINPIERLSIVNIKQFVSAWYEDKPCSIGDRLTKHGLKFIGSLHSGIDDAINIVRILRKTQEDCPIPIVEAFDLFTDGGRGSLIQYKFANKSA